MRPVAVRTRSGCSQGHRCRLCAMPANEPTRLLIVTDRPAVTPALLEAIRDRRDADALDVRILIPNPAPAEWHPTHPERHAKATAAQRVLDGALPRVREAAGVPVDGFVSTRHDPMDGIEELLHDRAVDELITATAPPPVESWLHVALPHRAAPLGGPVPAIESGDGRHTYPPRSG